MNIKSLIAKIKSTKNIEIYLAVALGLILVCVLVFAFPKGDNSAKVTENSDEYIAEMENKISSVISKMEGVGNVKVAISYSALGEKVYAYKEDSEQSLVTVKGEPLVIKTLPPQICGVVVVADGAESAVTKFKIKQVVVTLLDVSADKVQVFTYKS